MFEPTSHLKKYQKYLLRQQATLKNIKNIEPTIQQSNDILRSEVSQSMCSLLPPLWPSFPGQRRVSPQYNGGRRQIKYIILKHAVKHQYNKLVKTSSMLDRNP